MKTVNQAGWVGVVLLSAVCLAMAGCDGSDGGGEDRSASSTPSGGSASSGTGSAGSGSSTQGTGSTTPPAAQQLVAPQVVTPQNNQVIFIGFSEDISFRWTPVPGATAYILELDGVQHGGTITTAKVNLGVGGHTCRVWGLVDGQAGPASDAISFTLEPILAP